MNAQPKTPINCVLNDLDVSKCFLWQRENIIGTTIIQNDEPQIEYRIFKTGGIFNATISIVHVTVVGMRKNVMPSLYERQKLIIERLYVKIDYHKAARLRVPTYVAIANYGLLALSTRFELNGNTSFFFVCGFLLIGFVGGCALEVVRKAFVKNVNQLDYLYDQIAVKNSNFQEDPKIELAEPASGLWVFLFILILIATALPSVLVLWQEFPSLNTSFNKVG